MMHISSKVGKRLARAKADLDEFRARYAERVPVTEKHRLLSEYDAAAAEVASELIAANHHLTEGDD